jgi:hypothetical protein
MSQDTHPTQGMEAQLNRGVPQEFIQGWTQLMRGCLKILRQGVEAQLNIGVS